MLLCDRYELGDVIGRGGMADVHAGVDTKLQRDVAIKILRPGSVAADDLETRFEEEGRVAARLQHPNVVAVFDTGVTDDGRPFIVMERLPGATLGDRMRTGALDDDTVKHIAIEVLAAMGAAHAAGVVHRDIKPGNILLTDDGHAKIADFGIARESDNLLVDPTTTNVLTGTPAYIAPERLVGRPATAQSDLWALGVVLYEALTGSKPVAGVAPLVTARPDVDRTLAATVDRAMAVDPDQRFGSAVEMAAAINGDATVILPRPPASPSRPRRRTAAIGAGIAAVILGVTIGVLAGRDGGTPPATPVRPASATATTTSSTLITASVPVQNVVPAPTRVRRGGKGKKGRND
jgi:eukaryotic-like serine/threonine-protein kinase